MRAMVLSDDTLEICFDDGDHGLSARRLWEHTEQGQINVFGTALTVREKASDAEAFIDVVQFEGDAVHLEGVTVSDLRARRLPRNSRIDANAVLVQLDQCSDGHAFIRSVQNHLRDCAVRRGLRNQVHPFLPSPKNADAFGVPMLYSGLQRRLQTMANFKAGADQWLKTIENFQKKGLRAEELECADLMPDLCLEHDQRVQFTATELADLCDFKALRLSVIPVVSRANKQLRFKSPNGRKLTRTKSLSKAVAALPRVVARIDPALGYRVERVEHQALWGVDQTWQAVTYGGMVLRNTLNQTGFRSIEAAQSLANSHANQLFPKRIALGQFSKFAWTGGEDYREWLITLPHYLVSYLSGHFNVRNVLAHVRCDVREGGDSERVLMLQEVQSDWAQRARRARSTDEMDQDDEVPPPFMKEWTALVMKLMLLHAAHQGLDGLAWTRGAQQVQRWNGLGASGLMTLYDRTLPRDIDRIMRPFGVASEMMGVFVPTNFSIKQTESGYEVRSPNSDLLGTAPTIEDARAFVPDQGHELLFDVHGVRLTATTRKAILEAGFPTWG
jgi:hypothetical protein